jgi:hypothetical protein
VHIRYSPIAAHRAFCKSTSQCKSNTKVAAADLQLNSAASGIAAAGAATAAAATAAAPIPARLRTCCVLLLRLRLTLAQLCRALLRLQPRQLPICLVLLGVLVDAQQALDLQGAKGKFERSSAVQTAQQQTTDSIGRCAAGAGPAERKASQYNNKVQRSKEAQQGHTATSASGLNQVTW